MKQIRLIMGMPITVKIAKNEKRKTKKDVEKVFDYFRYVDGEYSPFKETSEVAKLNRGEMVSEEMTEILKIAQDLKKKTGGYFDIKRPDGKIDPSGIVKGWAIKNASDILRKLGYERFYIDAGGDAEIVGKNWAWGIRNPFNKSEIVKILNLSDCGIATSGTYEKGQHIYNPIGKNAEITDIVSLTVIGPNVFEADKFATPAFAMGKEGINFVEKIPNLEGYMIDKNGIATMTSGFSNFVVNYHTLMHDNYRK
jgi:thiamine biosynthesis lipoprotein